MQKKSMHTVRRRYQHYDELKRNRKMDIPGHARTSKRRHDKKLAEELAETAVELDTHPSNLRSWSLLGRAGKKYCMHVYYHSME